MPVSTDILVVSENDSHSDSDWLDIASTDRDSDDNDSIYSARETDHEDPSRSRSRRSSLSYGSSRDGDVDAWEGLIEDSADEAMHGDVLAPHHVASLSQHPLTLDPNETQEISPEELRVKEGLDQSMMSTLSSSRSSSLHASTIHNSSRDLRLSFPDPITSSCREPLSTSYEDIQPSSDFPSSAHLDAPHVDDEEMASASQILSIHPQPASIPSPSAPELNVFLYGFPTIFKWSIISKLLQRVVHGAGLTINSDLENLQGPVRRLTISGSFEHDHTFPRMIAVLDRTLQPYDAAADLALMESSCVRPLAIIFLPCHSLDLPDHVLHLPIIPPSYSSELPDFGNIGTGSPQVAWDMLNVSSEQILRIAAPGEPSMIDSDSINLLDPVYAYKAFSRLWSGDNVPKGVTAGTHALTIIAILSLILGLVVRAALPVSLQQFASPTLTVLTPNYTSASLWQILRPGPCRERLPPSTTMDSSVVVIPSAFNDFSLSIFTTESTSMTLSRTECTNIRRVITPTPLERAKFSKDLMLQPSRSILLDSRPKALSVIPESSPTTSYHASPDAIINQDMQDILDALDALVQALSRQTQMILAQATTFIEQSAMYLEKSVDSLETVKETLHVHNERARARAKEIKEKGAKWLYDASEVVSTGARFSQGMALELAEGLVHRAQRARGKAKEMAMEIQEYLNDYEGFEVLEADTWVKRARKRGEKLCKRKRRSSILC